MAPPGLISIFHLVERGRRRRLLGDWASRPGQRVYFKGAPPSPTGEELGSPRPSHPGLLASRLCVCRQHPGSRPPSRSGLWTSPLRTVLGSGQVTPRDPLSMLWGQPGPEGFRFPEKQVRPAGLVLEVEALHFHHPSMRSNPTPHVHGYTTVKTQEITMEDVEKSEPLFAASGNGKWGSHSEQQSGSSSKN